MRIETVRGPIDTSQLGTTLMHEHIFVLSPEVQQNYPGQWNEEERLADAAAKLNALKLRGVDTLVDVTVLGLGRDVARIQRLARHTTLQIVVATGLYIYHDLPLYFHFRGPGTLFGGPEILADMFVGDITDGIAGTGVKAALLKCATEVDGVTPGIERTLPPPGEGLEQQCVFREEGVDLARVIIGHAGDSTDLDYLRTLMDNGSTIGMDRFGIEVMLPLEDRVNTVAQLCKAGYADRMVLSHDTSCFVDVFPDPAYRAMLPNWSYTHILDDVLPALRERGVEEAQIRQMFVENPRRIFEHGGPY